MSMRLTPQHLSEIAAKVLDIDELGIEVKVIEVHGHDVHLKRQADKKHAIVGISDKTQGGTTR